MPSRIKVLPAHVINKIAAGEVVERPASVLKELVENALDAGATQVDVEVTAGGRKLLAVSDNGSGMSRDDAILCIEQHATSKIHDVDDIEHIATLGFRGEALAAIASVSRFRLATCAAGEAVGTEVNVVAGVLRDVLDLGRPAGTTIEVRDLFLNVPARRKFLRSDQTELAHIRTGFILQALARPETGMSLRVDGKELWRLAGGATLRERLGELFGPELPARLREVDSERSGVRVTGYASHPGSSRSDRDEQYVFVNRRPTSAPVISYAIRESYHTLLPSDRHPSVFLFVDVDPGDVDVNVHPTKREVRFRRSGDVRDAMITAIREALASEERPGEGAAARPVVIPPQVTRAAELMLKIDNLPPARAFRYPRMPVFPGSPAAPPVAPPSGTPDAPLPPAVPAAEATASGSVPGEGQAPWSWCRVLGQIGSLYVLMETEDGLVLMDPHAAHERVLFERFMTQVLARHVHAQNLLLPESVALSPGDALRVRRNADLLVQMGFGISEFGADTFVVDAMPDFFAGVSPSALLAEVAASLEQAGTRGGTGRWREEAIAQAACKAAVKARQRLTLEAIEQLVVDLARTEMPYTCPHGRPTLIFMSLHELNRKFGRE